MNDANHFRPDQAGEFPFTTEVEMLLGGIGRAMYPDGTLQFAEASDVRLVWALQLESVKIRPVLLQNSVE